MLCAMMIMTMKRVMMDHYDGVPPLQCIGPPVVVTMDRCMWNNLHDGYQDLSFSLKSESIADWSDLLSSARGKSGR